MVGFMVSLLGGRELFVVCFICDYRMRVRKFVVKDVVLLVSSSFWSF